MTPRIGRRFGRLIVTDSLRLERADLYLCKCDCGGVTKADWKALKRGDKKSCGCLAPKITYGKGRNHSRTGAQKHPLYNLWRGMVRRCADPSSYGFPRYGARGVTVCDRWRNDFFSFVDDMGPRPANTSLDRIDNNKGYMRENCRWATQKEQANNTRKTRYIAVDGVKTQVSALRERYKLSNYAIRSALEKGYQLHEAVAYAMVVRARWLQQQRGLRVNWSVSEPEVRYVVEKYALSSY